MDNLASASTIIVNLTESRGVQMLHLMAIKVTLYWIQILGLPAPRN